MDQIGLMRIFTAVADHESLAAAARALSLSPSAVTTALQRLEERVGAPLAIRTTRRLSLTPEGERFLVDCRRILGDLQEAMDSVADRGALRGEIRVTATNDFGRAVLAPAIDAFIHAHPGVSVALTLSDSILDLGESRYDLALRMGVLGESRPDQRLLMRGLRKICAAPAYWARMGVPKHPRDLLRHNCLVLSRPDSPQTHWPFQENGREFQIRVSGDRTANDGATLRGWAVAGAGVALKSSLDVREDLAAGRLIPALEAYEIAENNLYAVLPPGRRAARRTRALIDHLAGAL